MAQANSFEHISIGAVKVLARLAAKRAVQAELKEAGVRVSLVKPAAINEQANKYLANHPELYDQARPRVERMIAEGVFGKRAQRAYLESNAQKQNEPKSTTSAVRISGA
jgi:NAD(P)-dependent dehydrogenase (short-subunit alcohol dehydrogenase family)